MGADLEREFKALSSRRAFGLNFERHWPEAVELPHRPIRKGDKVRILPKRGSSTKGDRRLWIVKKIEKAVGTRTARLELFGSTAPETQDIEVDDLVVVAEFRDYIYPGLVSSGKVECGSDKPFHAVINGENYHVLKALTYTHRGKVDAIYIDPPFNSGAKDWKYNNDFVDKEDIYRHSKWLAFIERRLLIAKELLNPQDSILIVTIDEKEYLRLGLLLEQIFPGQRIQMISSSINPKGVARGKEFYRVDEYIYFIYFGSAVVQNVMIPGLCISKSEEDSAEQVANSDDIDAQSDKTPSIRWASLLRSGKGARRDESKLKFYPVLVDLKTAKIIDAGDPLPLDQHPEDYSAPKGLTPIWPMRQDNSQGRWQLNQAGFRTLLADQHIKIGSIDHKSGKVTFYYLMTGQREKLATDELLVTGLDKYGGLELKYSSTDAVSGRPKTQWATKAHSATDHGTSLLRKIIPGRNFPYPKSLYAVEDALRFFVANKPSALVLDFFAGSGTTVHAVMRLNHKDGGKRQCISITNNEVAAGEQATLRKQGLRPGDSDWEKWGICDYITKPRVEAAITGFTPEGKPIGGNYSFKDEFPIADGFEENAEFFTLTYETPVAVNHNLAFERIAPLLWMRAGNQGRRIEALPDLGWDVADVYGLLTDLDQASAFCKAVEKVDGIRVAYIVTNDDRRFQAVARSMPDSVEPVRLYESYLTNFQFANGE